MDNIFLVAMTVACYLCNVLPAVRQKQPAWRLTGYATVVTASLCSAVPDAVVPAVLCYSLSAVAIFGLSCCQQARATLKKRREELFAKDKVRIEKRKQRRMIDAKKKRKKKLTIFVRDLEAKTVTVQLAAGSTVADLKLAIGKKTKVPVELQNLLFPSSGKFATAADDATLENAGCFQGSARIATVQLVLKRGVAGGVEGEKSELGSSAAGAAPTLIGKPFDHRYHGLWILCGDCAPFRFPMCSACVRTDEGAIVEGASEDGAASPVKKKSSARKKENPLFDEDDAAAAATQKEADEAVGTQAAATTTSVS